MSIVTDSNALFQDGQKVSKADVRDTLDFMGLERKPFMLAKSVDISTQSNVYEELSASNTPTWNYDFTKGQGVFSIDSNGRIKVSKSGIYAIQMSFINDVNSEGYLYIGMYPEQITNFRDDYNLANRMIFQTQLVSGTHNTISGSAVGMCSLEQDQSIYFITYRYSPYSNLLNNNTCSFRLTRV